MAVLTSKFAAEKGDELALADDVGTLTWAEFDQPIKTLGKHNVDVRLNAGVNATVKVVVTSEDAPAVTTVKKTEPAVAAEEK